MNKAWDIETGETYDCHREGISGNCGLNCRVLLAGECDSEDKMMEDYKYYCPRCDYFYTPSDVEEQTDGISDTLCPDCDKPLQEEDDYDKINNSTREGNMPILC